MAANVGRVQSNREERDAKYLRAAGRASLDGEIVPLLH